MLIPHFGKTHFGKTVAALTVMLCWMTAPAHGAVQYNIVMLDVLPGGLDSEALGLNDVGQVVGTSLRNRGGNVGQMRPVVWDYSGQPHELWTDQSVGGNLADINNAGEIVGSYGSGSGIPLPTGGVPYGRAFYWNASTGRQDIGFEPVGNSRAIAINDNGQVAGSSERLEFVVVETGGTPQPLYIPHAFIWDADDGIRELGGLGGFFTLATAMNNVGQVVGYGDLANGHERAFIWDEQNGMRELPTLNGGETRAVAINDLGQVLGGGPGMGAVIWDLPSGNIMPVPGGRDLNNLGQAVGGAYLVDQNQTVRLLTDLIPSA